MTTRTSWPVHLGDLTVTLSAPEPWAHEQQAVLADFLPGPIGHRDLGHLRLDVHLDDDRVDRLTTTAATRTGTRHIETIPGVTLIETPDGPDTRVLTVATDALEGAPGTHAVRIGPGRVELLIHSTAHRQHRLPLRLLREAMIRTYENSGATMLHAAGASVRGAGIAVCGPRSAGKTTTLAALLAATGADLLSNDRLLLPPAEGGQSLVAVPLPVPLAGGTIDAIDSVRAALATTRRPQPPLHSLPREFGTAVKADLTAREFVTAMGGRLAAHARLDLLLVPRLTDDTTPFTTRPLPLRETRAVLAANCFTPHDEFWLVPWLIPHRDSTDALATRSSRHLDAVATATPAVEIHFGVRNPFADLVAGLRRTLGDRP